jgi:hypothetical protein
MVQGAMANATTGHPDHHAATALCLCVNSGAVSDLCSLVDDLVESWVDVIGELDLGNRTHAFHCSSDCEASNALFGQRSIKDTVLAEFIGQVHGAAEDATESDVFAEQHDTLI